MRSKTNSVTQNPSSFRIMVLSIFSSLSIPHHWGWCCGRIQLTGGSGQRYEGLGQENQGISGCKNQKLNKKISTMSEKTLVELRDSETLEDETVDLTPQIAIHLPELAELSSCNTFQRSRWRLKKDATRFNNAFQRSPMKSLNACGLQLVTLLGLNRVISTVISDLYRNEWEFYLPCWVESSRFWWLMQYCTHSYKDCRHVKKDPKGGQGVLAAPSDVSNDWGNWKGL